MRLRALRLCRIWNTVCASGRPVLYTVEEIRSPARSQPATGVQVNSNVLVKAAASSRRICSALVFKSWWDPSVSVSLMGGWSLDEHAPCAGISLHVDNDSDLRYERGLHTTGTGSLVRQKHAASKAEGLVAQGRGWW